MTLGGRYGDENISLALCFADARSVTTCLACDAHASMPGAFAVGQGGLISGAHIIRVVEADVRDDKEASELVG